MAYMRKRYMLASLAAVALGIGSVADATIGQYDAAPTLENRSSKLKKINHFVVIYEENHSFDNLYGGWEGVNGLGQADPARTTTQVNQAGSPFDCLQQDDVNLTSPPLPGSCTDTTNGITSAFFNAPFRIDNFIQASDTTCPAPGVSAPNGVANNTTGLPGGCTRDLVHRFYQEQYQIDDGKMDRYVTGSDAVGLAMGYYDTTLLPIYKYLHLQPNHPRYAIADNFFQAAFGGSFLNHQWLIAAATPIFKDAPQDGTNDLHSIVDTNGMPISYPLYKATTGTVKDSSLTVKCKGASAGVACGDYAINTTQPYYQPYLPGTVDAKRLPPLMNTTIGDKLSAEGIDWAWYSGGWSNANGDENAPGWTNGSGPSCSDSNTIAGASYPNCADKLFQFHHQPFNYYANYAPGTEARAQHLRDEQEFIQLAQSSSEECKLKPVSFIKPIGAENEHPGYASESNGSNHLVDLLQAVEDGACAKDTMIIVTYDEFGGQWDHVPPPGQGKHQGPHDQWGPGTRVPTLIVSPYLRSPFVVDHTQYDTTSILATIEHRYGLAPLGTRDKAVYDLFSVFEAKGPHGEKDNSKSDE